MRAIARQILQTDDLPELRTLDPSVLLTILRALKIHLNRYSKVSDPTAIPTPSITSMPSTRSIVPAHHATA